MRLEDEVGLAGNPDAVGDEVVRKDGWIQLVVGLVSLSLVDVGQRWTVCRGWLGRGCLRGGYESLGGIGQKRLSRQRRKAKQHG